MIQSLAAIFIFPGILFLLVFGLALEFFDRKLSARLQNRMGPPWFQPFADILKLIGKETVVPADADRTAFRLMPVFALTASITAFFYVPLWGGRALFSFEGDVIVVLYLLTIPTLTFFLGGWYSRSVYAAIGAVRALTQLFAYEVPLFAAILAAALLADSWSITGITEFYLANPGYAAVNGIGFFLSLIMLLGKLEKVPFDIPEAETEIVAGSFTEYSGRYLALFRLAIDVELVVCASLLVAVFLPFGAYLGGGVGGFVVYVAAVAMVVAGTSLLRTLFARLRIDQMIMLCWKVFAPLAFVQVVINLIVKGVWR